MATNTVKRRVQTYDLTMMERAAVVRAAKADRRSVSAWVAQTIRGRLAAMDAQALVDKIQSE